MELSCGDPVMWRMRPGLRRAPLKGADRAPERAPHLIAYYIGASSGVPPKLAGQGQIPGAGFRGGLAPARAMSTSGGAAPRWQGQCHKPL
jgi:hypothetical protein